MRAHVGWAAEVDLSKPIWRGFYERKGEAGSPIYPCEVYGSNKQHYQIRYTMNDGEQRCTVAFKQNVHRKDPRVPKDTVQIVGGV